MRETVIVVHHNCWQGPQQGLVKCFAHSLTMPSKETRGGGWVVGCISHLGAALEGASAHLRDKLQCAAQLLPGPAQRDHGRVCVGVAQPPQRMALRQRAHPVKQLPRPANTASNATSLSHDMPSYASPSQTICLSMAWRLIVTSHPLWPANRCARCSK